LNDDDDHDHDYSYTNHCTPTCIDKEKDTGSKRVILDLSSPVVIRKVFLYKLENNSYDFVVDLQESNSVSYALNSSVLVSSNDPNYYKNFYNETEDSEKKAREESKNNLIKNYKTWGGMIAHVGFVLLVLGALLSQYQKNVGEDDLSTLKEILTNHDLDKDKPAGTFVEFTKRSLDNYNNRWKAKKTLSNSVRNFSASARAEN
jgi:hypothetical protein